MRSAGNFSPEWGYLAPVPSLMRTVRVVLVATAVGATAGAAVVLSLVDRPVAGGEADVAALPIVTSIRTVAASHASAGATPAVAVGPARPSTPAAALIAAAPVAVEAPPASALSVVAAPQVTELPAPVSSQTAVPAAENSGMADTAPVLERRVAPGMAALSESSPATGVTASDAMETQPAAAEAPPPQKKTKRVAAGPAKSKSGPTLGSVLGSLFNPHTNAASAWH